MHRGFPNVEDRLRVALKLEAALRVLGDARADDIRVGIDTALEGLCRAVLSAESAIHAASEQMKGSTDRYTPAGYLVAFLLAFGSRTPTRDRLRPAPVCHRSPGLLHRSRTAPLKLQI